MNQPKSASTNHHSSVIDSYVQSGFITIEEGLTVGEVFDRLRTLKIEPQIFYLYVVNGEGILKGVLPVRRLLASLPQTPLQEITVRQVCALKLGMTVADALDFFVTYRFLALPVVNEQGKLVGVVNVDQFADPLTEISEGRVSSDVFSILGLKMDEARISGLAHNLRMRLPWLMVNVVGGFGCAWIAGVFSWTLQQSVTAAFFIPIVLVLGESIGVQTTAIAVRRFHLQMVSAGSIVSLLIKEVVHSLIFGILIGCMVGVIAFFWQGDPRLAAALALSITLSMGAAGFLGTVLPALFKATRIDPAIASGPLVLAISDNLTMLLYFLSIRLWMGI